MPIPKDDFIPASTPPPGRGRAFVPFDEAAASTQRHRISSLAREKVVGELLGAAQKRAADDGDTDLAFIIKRMRINRWGDG